MLLNSCKLDFTMHVSRIRFNDFMYIFSKYVHKRSNDTELRNWLKYSAKKNVSLLSHAEKK